MKTYTILIFLLFALIADGQVSDNFNDGDFTNSPTWNGDSSNFNVNIAGQLQLTAAIAGNSFLSVPANLVSLDSCEWHFFIRLDFSPSTSNYCRVYLASDTADLQLPLNGYYLQFGESLSNDAIELFRQDGSSRTSVCRATNGLIANSFSVGVRVERNSSGLWTISVDYAGGINYSTEVIGIDATYNNAGWIGVNCVYTSGNIAKFFFDDFYAGHIIPDTVAPAIIGVNVETGWGLSITFSEVIDSSSLSDLNNYSVDNGIGNPIQIVRDSVNELKYILHFSNSFIPGIDYSISVSGLRDASQNVMSNQSFSFSYSPEAVARVDDIVFTEIYFEPNSLSPLPDGEYVEIYNRRDSAIDITGWKISDGNSDGLISARRLGPFEYVVLHSDNDSLEFLSIPNAVAVNSFPTLNNDGDHLKMMDGNDLVINEIEFDNESYHDSHKDDGGWSIERIDREFICENGNNWKASNSNLHGTPGKINSVNANFFDDTSPYILNAYLADSNNLMVIFSEEVSVGSDNLNNYSVNSSDGTVIIPQTVSILSGDAANLFFTNPFQGGIYFLRITSELRDCPGNAFLSNYEARFGIAEEVISNDVIINELLFDCYDGGTDFLELYNRSQKIIDLKDWTIAETDHDDSTDVKEIAVMSDDHRLLFPGDYLVLSENELMIKEFYSCENSNSFLNVSSMPDFNSDDGRVIIYDMNGNAIDAFSYEEDMHFPLLAITKGVSLERLSPEIGTNENINWHSAAATAGFATPGSGNSQRVDPKFDGEGVTLGGGVFSPDDDGYDDVLCVRYRFPQGGTVLSLNVYDYCGQPVRELLSGQTVSNEGVISWDGLTDDRTIAPAGVYILFARSFDLEGNDRVFKKACYLTRKY